MMVSGLESSRTHGGITLIIISFQIHSPTETAAYKAVTPLPAGRGVTKTMPATSYSPTELPLQYHRRWRA